MRARAFRAGLLILGLSAALPAAADPLPPEACAALTAERDALLADGVKTDRDHGPDWAKANLPRDRLTKIAKLIETEEQLSFRCDIAVTARPTLAKPPKNQDQDNDRPAGANAASGTKAKSATDDAAPTKKKKKRRTATAPGEAPAETGAGDSESSAAAGASRTPVPETTGSTRPKAPEEPNAAPAAPATRPAAPPEAARPD